MWLPSTRSLYAVDQLRVSRKLGESWLIMLISDHCVIFYLRFSCASVWAANMLPGYLWSIVLPPPPYYIFAVHDFEIWIKITTLYWLTSMKIIFLMHLVSSCIEPPVVEFAIWTQPCAGRVISIASLDQVSSMCVCLSGWLIKWISQSLDYLPRSAFPMPRYKSPIE